MINDLLQSKLEILADDDLALTAIEAVFNDRVESEKPVLVGNETNEVLGEKYRSFVTAQEIIKLSLGDIKNYKRIKENNNSFNKAK